MPGGGDAGAPAGQERKQVKTSAGGGLTEVLLVLGVTSYLVLKVTILFFEAYHSGSDGDRVRPVMKWRDSDSLDSGICTPLDNRAFGAKAPSCRTDAGIRHRSGGGFY